jgi:hypothetical protein
MRPNCIQSLLNSEWGKVARGRLRCECQIKLFSACVFVTTYNFCDPLVILVRMDIIALRKGSGNISGDVLLNGYLQEPISFKRCSGYVEQFGEK